MGGGGNKFTPSPGYEDLNYCYVVDYRSVRSPSMTGHRSSRPAMMCKVAGDGSLQSFLA